MSRMLDQSLLSHYPGTCTIDDARPGLRDVDFTKGAV